MTPVSTVEYEQLSGVQAARVDAACDTFEQAWKSVALDGPRPGISSFCADLGEPERTVLVWELMALDRDYRARRGETPRPEDYRGLCSAYDEQLPDFVPTNAIGEVTRPTSGESWPNIPGMQIVEVLGAGGMGVVYKAWQPTLDRYVAVKMLRDVSLNDSEHRERFHREAQAVARLQHPNMVQVYELGETQPRDGTAPQPYFVFEFVGGGNLADRLRGNPQAPRVAAQLVETLARALSHAHERGIIHRDLKPANILLAPASDKRTNNPVPTTDHWPLTTTPKITDFGLAKFGRDSDLTRTGDTLGTPSYMAPEQIEGKASSIGQATDVYGLGAILYEVLTGRPPFKAETPLATVLQVQRDEPVPLRRLQPTVPADLETICLKCLQKEPRRRYDTANTLAEDLRRFTVGEPIYARPAGAVEHAVRWCRRKPAVASLMAALALAVVGGFVGITSLWLVADKNRRAAVINQQQAEDNFRLAQKAVDDLATKVSNDRRLRSTFRPLRKELLETAVKFYDQFVELRSDDPKVRAELADAYRRLGQMVREIDDPDRAIACYQKARDLFAELERSDPKRRHFVTGLARSEYSLALLYNDTGRSAEFEQSSGRTIALQKRLVAAFPNELEPATELARCHINLGSYYQRAAKYPLAEAEYQTALKILDPLRAEHPTDIEVAICLYGCHNWLGMMYTTGQKRVDAIREYRVAMSIQRQLIEREPDDEDFQNHLAATLNNIGRVFYQARQYPDAEREFTAAANINRALVAKLPEVTQYHQFLAANESNLGNVCRDTKRPDEALAHYRESNDILRRLIARQPKVPVFLAEVANNLSCIGHTLNGIDKPAEALVQFDEAIRIHDQVKQRGAANASTKTSFRNAHWRRAESLEALGRYPEAIQAWEQAHSLDDGPDRDKLRLRRARSVARSGDHRSAVAEVESVAPSASGGGDRQFQLARLYAAAFAAATADVGVNTSERERLTRYYSERAIAFAATAKDSGYFQDKKRIAELKSDKDFGALQSNPTFQSFVAELDAVGR